MPTAIIFKSLKCALQLCSSFADIAGDRPHRLALVQAVATDRTEKKRQRTLAPFAAALAVVVSVTGCGGGGGETEVPVGQADGTSMGLASTAGQTRPLAANAQKAPSGGDLRLLSTVVIRAGSSIAEGQGAFLMVRYNGRVLANLDVSGTTLQDFTLVLAELFNGGVLDVAFTNASFANGQPARRLVVESVSINGTSFSPTGPGVIYDLGHGLAAFDGIGTMPGTGILTSTGALRIPLPAASQMGGQQRMPATLLTASPGAYVDPYKGADDQPGTFERPFKTLARLLHRPLLSGENIFLRCGRQFREALSLGVSQLNDGTQIRAYGDDCPTAGKPVISGSDVFSGGWTKTGQQWSRALPAGTPKITRLWLGDAALRTAQWPNADQSQPLVRATYAPDPWRFWLSDADTSALAGRDIRGATVLLRTQAWRIEERQVAQQGSQGSEVAISTNPDYAIEPGDAWVMRDKAWMLDAPGEFFHDVQASKLYLIAPAAQANVDVNALKVEGSVRAVALDLRGRKQLEVRDIALRNAQQDGARLTNAPSAVISHIESRENGVAGIRLMQWEPLADGVPGSLVENSFFAANGEYGIDTTYVRGARISGNKVLETGLGTSIGGSIAAIAAGPAATVQDNIVDGSAYAGIMFSSLGPTLISGNEISNYCVRLSDCGAIYTWSQQSQISPQQNSTIEKNRIFGGQAASYGSPFLDSQVVAGIYLDDFSQGVTVRQNFLQNLPIGIFLHNAGKILVEQNQIWFARSSALSVAMDRTDGDWSTGNLLRGNDIVPMTTASAQWPALPQYKIAHPVHFAHALSGAAALGVGRNEFSGNIVRQLNGVIPEHASVSGPAGVQAMSIAEWRAVHPGEPDLLRPMVMSPIYVQLGTEKVPGGQFDNGLGDWIKHWNWQVTGFDAQPAWSQAGCTGHCVRLTVAERGDALMSPAFSLRAGIPHVYSWTAVSAGASATVGQSYLARSTSPWDQMNDGQGFVSMSSRQVAAGQSQRYEAFFTPKSNAATKVVLQLETTNTPVFLDAVSIREVEGYAFSTPAAWAAAIVAPAGESRSINGCAELGWPADCLIAHMDGTPTSFPISVAPRTQRMVLWANSPFRR